MGRRAVLLVSGLAFAAAVWMWWPTSRPEPAPTAVGTAYPRRISAKVVSFARPRSPGALSGAVTTVEGDPVANATVCAACAGCNAGSTGQIRCTASAENGLYGFDELLPMAYRVTAWAEGFGSAAARDGEAIVVARRSRESDVDIVLGRDGAEVSGVVLDATGGPVAGVEVRLVQWLDPPVVLTTRSDDDGRFVAWVKPGRVTVTAGDEDYSTAGVTRTAPCNDVEITLTPGGALSGTVVMAEDGSVVADAQVTARLVQGSRDFARSARSDAHGGFVLRGLEPGLYALEATGSGHRGALERPVPIQGVGDHVHDLVLAVEPATQVRGRIVIGSTGAPCVEGAVMLGPRPPPSALDRGAPVALIEEHPSLPDATAAVVAETAPQGEVHFEAVPPARYWASVRCRDHTWREGPATVDVGEEDLDGLVWEVEPGIGFELQVVDGSGAPVAYAQPFLEFPGQERSSDAEPTRGVAMPLPTDSAGRYRHPRELYPGRYVIRSDRTHRAEPITFEARDGTPLTELVLQLEGSSAIEAHVRAPDGRALGGLHVAAYPYDEESSAPIDHRGVPAHLAALMGIAGAIPGSATGQGGYWMGPLAAGTYRLEIVDGINPPWAEAADGAPVLVTVHEGETANVEVELERGAKIWGRVVDSSGAPVQDVWVTLDSERDDAPTVQGPVRPRASRRLTDLEGRFEFEGLRADATFGVNAATVDGAGTAVQAGVQPGSEIVLALREPESPEGAALRAEGLPVSRSASTASPLSGRP